MGDLSFIANRESIEPAEFNFDPIPAGIYKGFIESAELADTKAGGKMLKATYSIMEPKEYANRKIFTSFNVENASEKAQAIGLGQLSACARACGLPSIPAASSALCNRPHNIRVSIKAAEGEYAARNEIKGFINSGDKLEKLVSKNKESGTSAGAIKGTTKAKKKDLKEAEVVEEDTFDDDEVPF